MKKLSALLYLLLAGFPCLPAWADQNPIIIPESTTAFDAGVPTGTGRTAPILAQYYLNPAIRSLATNFAGANCTGLASPLSYQWCVDTTAKTLYMRTPTSGGVFSWNPFAFINADASFGYTGSYFYASSPTLPGLFLQNTGAAANAREWGLSADASTLYLSAFNDAESQRADVFQATRNAGTYTIKSLNFPVAPSFNATGVVADSSTDNCTTLNAALALGDVMLPSAKTGAYYRSSCTIVVPFGVTLRGMGQASPPGAGSIGGAKIVCDATVSPCIQVGQGNTNNVSAIRNIGQSRAGGSPGSTTIGIWTFGGQMSNMDTVQADNNGINFLWGRSTTGAGAGVSHTATALVSTRASDVHMMFDGIPDVRISRSHIGSVGPNDYHANAAFRFACTQNDCSGAGGANTIIIENMQVNQGFHRIEYFADFVNADTSFAATYGVFNFDNIYSESINHFIHSDSSWKRISELKISNSVITTNTTTAEGAGGRFFSLDPATAVDRWHITNSTLYGAADGGVQAFRLNPVPASGCGICELHISNSSLYGDFYLTGFSGSTTAIANTTFSTNYTVDGSWAYYNEFGTNIGGTYSEAAGTNVAIFNNRQIRFGSALGVDCASGITASTYRSVKGLTTHC